MKREVFRESALKQVTTPGRFDEILSVTQPRDWLALAAIAIILAVAAVWGETGRISRKVSAQGVLVLKGGVVNVFAEGAGRVHDLRVKPGDWVEPNQLIGSISQPALEDKLKALRERLEEAERERDRSGSAHSEGVTLQRSALQNQKGTLRRTIADYQQQIRNLQEQLQVEEELLGKGLITRQQVLSTSQKRTIAESGIAGIEAQLKQLDSNQFQNEVQVTQLDRESDARVTDLQRQISLLEKELGNTSLVRSPFAGKVIEVKVYPGVLVSGGEPVVSLEPQGENVEVILYVPSVNAKEIRPGMDVEVTPASIPREEYGFIRGWVSSVAEFPATRASVIRSFENESLASALAAGGPVNEMRVQLLRDPGSASGFKWSSSQGPSTRITSGTLCSAETVTRVQRPISLVIPFLRKTAGGN